MMPMENPLRYFSLKNNGGTLLEKRVARLYGDDYNIQFLIALRESNPKSYRNLNKLITIAIRKKEREQRRKYISNILDTIN